VRIRVKVRWIDSCEEEVERRWHGGRKNG